jgi:hypothetical protein
MGPSNAERLVFNVLRLHPDECLRARAAAQLNPEQLDEELWEGLDEEGRIESRLLDARIAGFEPGDFDGGDRLCTCGRWEWGPINPCGWCLHEKSAPWQSGYWHVVGMLGWNQPKTLWPERWRKALGYGAIEET